MLDVQVTCEPSDLGIRFRSEIKMAKKHKSFRRPVTGAVLPPQRIVHHLRNG